jgi:DNA-binding CsgD family transcriptional regulator
MTRVTAWAPLPCWMVAPASCVRPGASAGSPVAVFPDQRQPAAGLCPGACGDLCAANRRWHEAITVCGGRCPGPSRPHALLRAGSGGAASPGTLAQGRRWGPAPAMTRPPRPSTPCCWSPEEPHEPAAVPGLPRLSARGRELATLVARDPADAQVAGELCISVRAVPSHLDWIRGKSGCRRRADLARLALAAGLIWLPTAPQPSLVRPPWAGLSRRRVWPEGVLRPVPCVIAGQASCDSPVGSIPQARANRSWPC